MPDEEHPSRAREWWDRPASEPLSPSALRREYERLAGRRRVPVTAAELEARFEPRCVTVRLPRSGILLRLRADELQRAPATLLVYGS